MVNISLRVLWRPDVEFLPWIYQQLGMDFDFRVLPSIGNEVLKAVVVRTRAQGPSSSAHAQKLTARARSPQAQYNADQLLTQRENVSMSIRDQARGLEGGGQATAHRFAASAADRARVRVPHCA